MWRRSVRQLAAPLERQFTQPGESPMNQTGGLPFFGNVYAGRLDAQAYGPRQYGGATSFDAQLLAPSSPARALWEDVGVRARIERCPYFALCDQVLYHNMDPAYLDPGLLSPEEHHLLLLFSRAYYEKWRTLHTRPPPMLSQLHIERGPSELLVDLLRVVGASPAVVRALTHEYLVDDASLIGMDATLWHTAYLDPANLDQLSGRVLEYAGMPPAQQEQFLRVLQQMRRMRVVRRDTPVTTTRALAAVRDRADDDDDDGAVVATTADTTATATTAAAAPHEELVVPYRYGVTLFDLYKFLGLRPYSGQLKVYDLVDAAGTRRVLTLQDEDTYFDFLVTLFYKADLQRCTIAGDLADDTDCTCRYTITVEPYTVDERRTGRWL